MVEVIRWFDHSTTPQRWTCVVWDTATDTPVRWPTWADRARLRDGADLTAAELEACEELY